MIRAESIQISPEILALIGEIDRFKGSWRSLGVRTPERLSILRRVATIESIGSSTRIEGSALSDREVEGLLSGLQIEAFVDRDAQEVAGYANLMELVYESWQSIPITENHVKQLHQTLLQHREEDAWHRGQYKTNSNTVAAFDKEGKQVGVVFEPATPFETPHRMSELLAWIEAETSVATLHPLLVVSLATVTFLEIHPFQDGNGRLSRVLTTLMLLRAGYIYVPYSSLESIIERSKEAYYLALRQTQQTIRTDHPNWQPWLVFFLRALCAQTRHLEAKLEWGDRAFPPLPLLALQIAEFAREHGRITMAEAIKVTGSNRNTLKLHLRNLVESGYLLAHGTRRGAWYEFRDRAES